MSILISFDVGELACYILLIFITVLDEDLTIHECNYICILKSWLSRFRVTFGRFAICNHQKIVHKKVTIKSWETCVNKRAFTLLHYADQDTWHEKMLFRSTDFLLNPKSSKERLIVVEVFELQTWISVSEHGHVKDSCNRWIASR